MNRCKIFTALLVLVFLATAPTVLAKRGKKKKVEPTMYEGIDKEQAAENLLQFALELADDGSWERIAVARMYYLSGKKERADQIIDSIRKKTDGDWMRIGRMYYQAGDWDKARDAFEHVISNSPTDSDWMAEIGAYYNLQGDRERAQLLFSQSFKEDGRDLYNTLKAAGSFLGVEER